VKLTQRTLGTLELPAGKNDVIYFDDDLPGFGIRIRSRGSRTFILQYGFGTRTRRHTLGKVTALSLSQARKMASELYARFAWVTMLPAKRMRDEFARLKLSEPRSNHICRTRKRTCGRALMMRPSGIC